MLLDRVATKVRKVDLDRQEHLVLLGRGGNLAHLGRLDKLEQPVNVGNKDHKDHLVHVVNLVLQDREEKLDHEEKLVSWKNSSCVITWALLSRYDEFVLRKLYENNLLCWIRRFVHIGMFIVNIGFTVHFQ